MGHIAGRNTGIREQTLEGSGNQFHIPFVADPPFFPVVVEILAFAFVVIDEIDGDLLCAQNSAAPGLLPMTKAAAPSP